MCTDSWQIKVDGADKLVPCSPGDPAAQEMTYNDIQNAEDLHAPSVDIKDFKMALKELHPTVGQDDMARQIEWTKEFGSEGA